MIGGRFRAAVVVVALLLLAGCTEDEPDAPPLPSATPSALASSSPEVAVDPPVAPEARKSAVGAEEFVRYFWDVYDYSYTIGDASPLRAISDEECRFCQDSAAKIDEISMAGHQVLGAQVDVVAAVAPPSDPNQGLIVAVVVSEHPSSVVAADGKVVERQPGFRNMQSEVAVVWRPSGWVVRALANDEQTGKPWG
jgi:hypothetical protein